jgi:hypothetical protein
VPSTIATDSAVRDGILLFRGADADGHTTAMMLHGTTTTTPSAEKTTTVFKIPAGRF